MTKISLPLILIAMLAFTLPCLATDYYVAITGNDTTGDGSAGNPWKTITKGLSMVSGTSSDTIHIAAGTYDDALGEDFGGTDSGIDMVSYTTLSGADKFTTIVDASGTGDRVFYCDGVNNSKFDNLSITGGSYDGCGGGIFCDNTTITIQDCLIFGNTAVAGGGICADNATLTITDTWIFDNTATSGEGGGIFADNAYGMYVEFSIIECNYGGGIWAGSNTVTFTIHSSNIVNNYDNDGNIGYGIEDGLKADEECLNATGNWWGSADGPETPEGIACDENSDCDENTTSGNNAVSDDIWFCEFSDVPLYDLICEESENAITLESFTAKAIDKSVVLEWQTGTEIDNLGFFVVRSEKTDSGYEFANKDIIPARGNVYSGHSYTYTDSQVKAGYSYFYWLVDLDINGIITIHGPVKVITNLARFDMEVK